MFNKSFEEVSVGVFIILLTEKQKFEYFHIMLQWISSA